MTRRRRRNADSSLELLLDTICNTFGGVLFLAILIAMLLQLRGRAATVASPSVAHQLEFERLTNQQVDARERLEKISGALREQDKLVAQFQSNSQSIAELERQKQQRDRLNATSAKLLENVAHEQQSINVEAQQLANLDAALAQAEREKTALDARLKRESAARQESARLPTLHDTVKREVPLCLRHGRLYRVLVNGQPNERDFEVGSIFGRRTLTPKPQGGDSIPRGDAGRALVESTLQQIKPDISYVAVFVWPDSYGQFRQMKEVLVQRGFEYRLVPMPAPANTLTEGASSAKVLR